MTPILVLRYIAAALAGYLLGNISISNILAWAVAKKDIRTMGSGNAGATNVLRNMGLKYAIPTFIGDALKAMLAAVLGCLIIGEGFFEFDWLFGYTCPQIFVGGFAAILGHNFPVFMGFKGGKGVSCSIGLLLVMNPLLGLGLVAVAVLANLFIKLYSLVSIATMALAAVLYSFLDAQGDWIEIGVLFAMLLLMVFMHRENIRRLIKGQESKIDVFK